MENIIRLFSVCHSYKQVTFLFERWEASIKVRVNINKEAITFTDIEKLGYSFVVLEKYNQFNYSEQNPRYLLLRKNVTNFKIFHGEKLILNYENFNQLFNEPIKEIPSRLKPD
jgi:hypothetical protein